MAAYIVLKLVENFTKTCMDENREFWTEKARDQEVSGQEDYTRASVEQDGLCLIKKEVIKVEQTNIDWQINTK